MQPTSETVLPPSEVTLKRHGLTLELWQEMLDRQDGVCGICGRVPPSRRLNIDHQHVRGYDSMEPEKQRRYHRGLLCFQCNKLLMARGVTVQKLENGARYLIAYMERRDS